MKQSKTHSSAKTQTPGSVTITGGALRGRSVTVPSIEGVRPTSSRVRMALFNHLAHFYELRGASVLDLCCGSGVLGIESLSRGASGVCFIDTNPQVLDCVRMAVHRLGMQNKCTFLKADCTNLPKASATPEFIFFDPPYGRNLIAPTILSLNQNEWFDHNTLMTIEEDAKLDINTDLPVGYDIAYNKSYGKTQIATVNKKDVS
jgi:16S rRNA (guanine966-N2)-methyltransferase